MERSEKKSKKTVSKTGAPPKLKGKSEKSRRVTKQKDVPKSAQKPEKLVPQTEDEDALSPEDEIRKLAETSSQDDVDIIEAEVVEDPKNKRRQRIDSNLPAVLGPTEIASTDPLTLYLAEVRKYPLLTPEEERKLAIRYRETGDKDAAHKLVTSNLRFVIKIAAEYSRFGAKMIDLIQEGNVGLVHAVKEFNPYKGVKLITYAVWWIRGYIREYLMRQHSIVRLGTTHNQRKLFYNLQQEEKKLLSMGLEADVPLLSSRLGVTEEDVKTMQKRLSGRDVSLDQTFDEDSKTTLMDLQRSEDEVGIDDRIGNQEEISILKDKIEHIRPLLNEKETRILDLRLLADDPLTLQEIGDQLGITRERARQLESRVLEKLKKSYQPEESSD